jgi:dynein intermediate chain 2
MAEFYQYTKARREFGKPCNFTDTKPMTTVLQPFEPKKKDEGYVLRNPSFIELDNLTELTSHNVNTLRVSTGDRSMFHREGGTRSQ